MSFGAIITTMSDSNGVIYFEHGMNEEDFERVLKCKNVQRGRLASLADELTSGTYMAGETPWTLDVPVDVALPCATQNEIDEVGATLILKNGAIAVCEGANLPTTLNGQAVIRNQPDVIYLPGKASNAGGVGVSGFEMSQNAERLTWTEEEVDQKLQSMMKRIYEQMEDAGTKTGGTLEEGANRAGFIKVATAMKELGWVQ